MDTDTQQEGSANNLNDPAPPPAIESSEVIGGVDTASNETISGADEMPPEALSPAEPMIGDSAPDQQAEPPPYAAGHEDASQELYSLDTMATDDEPITVDDQGRNIG